MAFTCECGKTYLDGNDVARLARISPITFRQKKPDAKPVPDLTVGNTFLYLESTVEAWLAARS